MDGIIYLTLEQAEVIHKKTIKYSGGGIYESLDTGKNKISPDFHKALWRLGNVVSPKKERRG